MVGLVDGGVGVAGVAPLYRRVRLRDQTEWIEGRLADVFTFRDRKAMEQAEAEAD